MYESQADIRSEEDIPVWLFPSMGPQYYTILNEGNGLLSVGVIESC